MVRQARRGDGRFSSLARLSIPGGSERGRRRTRGCGGGRPRLWLDARRRHAPRSDLANQEYGSWQSNLQGLGAQGLNAANSISANNQTAGGYQMTGGATGAQLAQTTGQDLGQAYVGKGTGEAGSTEASAKACRTI